MKRGFEFIFLAILGLVSGFGAKSLTEKQPISQRASSKSSLPRTSLHSSISQQASVVLAESGSAQVTSALNLIKSFTRNSQCLQFASQLSNNTNNRDSDTLWCAIFARWSEIDPQGMINFAESESNPELKLLAWEAWAATDPELLATKVLAMGPPVADSILQGIASQNPKLALATAFQTPGGYRMIGSICKKSEGLSEEALRSFEKLTAYDGMRIPILKKISEDLYQQNPQEALSFVKDQGRIWSDPVAKMFGKIAREDPDKAARLLSEEPASRSKAISTVQIAKVWATQNIDASLEWTRSQHVAQVRDASLVAIASVIGGEDPDRALRLLEEVGWQDVGHFYAIGSVKPEGKIDSQIQEHDIAMTHQVGRSLLQNLAERDPEGTQQYIHSRIPEDRRALFLNISPDPENK